jgi:hypothetical protein
LKVNIARWEAEPELKEFMLKRSKQMGMTMTGYQRHLVMEDRKRAEREERRKAK